MSIEAAKACIEHAMADLAEALIQLEDEPHPPEPSGPIVRTPEEFDQALAGATAGSAIVCATSLVYTTALTLTLSDLSIQSEHAGEARMSAEEPAPQFTNGITIKGERVSLIGLEIRRGNLMDILVLVGRDPVIDRCRILGDPAQGAKRGIAANAPNVTITRCYIDECFGPYPGNDTQAIIAWDTPGPIAITDNYLCGGTETIMIGGADPASETNIPSDILIAGNTITKDPEWQAQAVSVKNTLELKNARRVRIEDNVIECSWGGHGQDGYLLMLTPRNQGGDAPYSTVEDVEITRNLFRCGAGAINVLGCDNNEPSEPLARVTIRGNRFEQIDPKLYTGSNKLILISTREGAPINLTIDANEFVGVNIGSQIYFTGPPPCEALTVTNNVFPASKYGIFGDGCSTGNGSNGLPHAWNTYVTSGELSGNTTTPAADPACEE